MPLTLRNQRHPKIVVVDDWDNTTNHHGECPSSVKDPFYTDPKNYYRSQTPSAIFKRREEMWAEEDAYVPDAQVRGELFRTDQAIRIFASQRTLYPLALPMEQKAFEEKRTAKGIGLAFIPKFPPESLPIQGRPFYAFTADHKLYYIDEESKIFQSFDYLPAQAFAKLEQQFQVNELTEARVLVERLDDAELQTILGVTGGYTPKMILQHIWHQEFIAGLRHIFPAVADCILADTEKMLAAIHAPKKDGAVEKLMQARGWVTDAGINFIAIADAKDKDIFLAAACDAFDLPASRVFHHDDNEDYQKTTEAYEWPKGQHANFILASPGRSFDLEKDLGENLTAALATEFPEGLLVRMSASSLPESLKEKLCNHPVLLKALKTEYYDAVLAKKTSAEFAADLAEMKQKHPRLHAAVMQCAAASLAQKLLEKLSGSGFPKEKEEVEKAIAEGRYDPEVHNEKLWKVFLNVTPKLPLSVADLFDFVLKVQGIPQETKMALAYSKLLMDTLMSEHEALKKTASTNPLRQKAHAMIGVWQMMQPMMMKLAILGGSDERSIQKLQEALSALEGKSSEGGAPKLAQAKERLRIAREEQQKYEILLADFLKGADVQSLDEAACRQFFMQGLSGLDQDDEVRVFLAIAKARNWNVRDLIHEKITALTRASIREGRIKAGENTQFLRGEKEESALPLLRECCAKEEEAYKTQVTTAFMDILRPHVEALQRSYVSGDANYADGLVADVLYRILECIANSDIPSDISDAYTAMAKPLLGSVQPALAASIFYNRVLGAAWAARLFKQEPGSSPTPIISGALQFLAQPLASLFSLASIPPNNIVQSKTMILALFDHYGDKAQWYLSMILHKLTHWPMETCEAFIREKTKGYMPEVKVEATVDAADATEALEGSGVVETGAAGTSAEAESAAPQIIRQLHPSLALYRSAREVSLAKKALEAQERQVERLHNALEAKGKSLPQLQLAELQENLAQAQKSEADAKASLTAMQSLYDATSKALSEKRDEAEKTAEQLSATQENLARTEATRTFARICAVDMSIGWTVALALFMGFGFGGVGVIGVPTLIAAATPVATVTHTAVNSTSRRVWTRLGGALKSCCCVFGKKRSYVSSGEGAQQLLAARSTP